MNRCSTLSPGMTGWLLSLLSACTLPRFASASRFLRPRTVPWFQWYLEVSSKCATLTLSVTRHQIDRPTKTAPRNKIGGGGSFFFFFEAALLSFIALHF